MISNTEYLILNLINSEPKNAHFLMNELNISSKKIRKYVGNLYELGLLEPANAENSLDLKAFKTTVQGTAVLEEHERMLRAEERSEEYNEIAKDANKKSDRANLIAAIALITSILALFRSW